MIKVQVKPLSVNEAYTGRRFSTPEKKAYSKAVLFSLPKITLPEPPYCIEYRFGMSNMGADVDGPTKVFQDLLSKKYGFNDNQVYRITAEKVKVEKGKEFIEFEIKHYSL